MNAYQILGIMSHIDNEMDEHSANEKIMNKSKNNCAIRYRTNKSNYK